jgi:hypothetical protein
LFTGKDIQYISTTAEDYALGIHASTAKRLTLPLGTKTPNQQKFFLPRLGSTIKILKIHRIASTLLRRATDDQYKRQSV